MKTQIFKKKINIFLLNEYIYLKIFNTIRNCILSKGLVGGEIILVERVSPTKLFHRLVSTKFECCKHC